MERSWATEGRSEGEVERSERTRCCSAGEYCGGSGGTCPWRTRETSEAMLSQSKARLRVHSSKRRQPSDHTSALCPYCSPR